MSEIDYAARVAKGVALLDEKRPGWERELDLETLDIRTATLRHGAAQRREQRGTSYLAWSSWTDRGRQRHVRRSRLQRRGVPPGRDQNYDSDDVYPVLNSLWRDVVTERLTAAQSD
jgi:hypothetical protein